MESDKPVVTDDALHITRPIDAIVSEIRDCLKECRYIGEACSRAQKIAHDLVNKHREEITRLESLEGELKNAVRAGC